MTHARSLAVVAVLALTLFPCLAHAAKPCVVESQNVKFTLSAPPDWDLECDPSCNLVQCAPISLTSSAPDRASQAFVAVGPVSQHPGESLSVESVMASERKTYKHARVVDAAPISTETGDQFQVTHYMATDGWPYWIASGYARVGNTIVSVYFECEREELFTQRYPAFRQIVQSLRLVANERRTPS
jgi:hypothetical protein